MRESEKADVAENPPPPSKSAPRLEPQDAAFLALHNEREMIERELTLAQQRQRYGTDDGEIQQARQQEASLLKDLDRVMTLIRAAEYKRQPGARRW
ncbi:hypothetical protein [Methylobacterium gnaphalii]|uniref:Uncharacterized protein n=1 Tax=Methylobacterium gnaphalii TaxID=1010610 RepID=A0A512JKW1_9HYPH|nr:hypothetical protein [Methylobacterium gnaphalii]GEP10599.1 hypothetical protein MGN01_24440 [Methylobacterium gnaphalii]GLS47837.1 hypothetical protein GCM10007885_06810 [Methylobacterium gnaphalii]